MLLSPGSNTVTYFAFQSSAETKKFIKQADIFQVTDKACKFHTNSLIIPTGAEVIQPRGLEVGCGGVEAGLIASVVEAAVSYGDM